ncbi:MAG: LacI family transcriptional regulator [Hyphomonadaceae bacterium]|nr:MAG: LacI family transcriptional regulator [Hyphomonadaceae bacterium]
MRGATLKDVAKAADVSIASASRAINGLDNVKEDLRRRVLEAASKLRYVPHGGARSLATNRTNTIGVILPDIYGEFFSEIIRGIDFAARARGLHILVSGSHGDLQEAVSAVRAMVGRVDGILVMSPFVDSQDLVAVLPLNLPLVTISSSIGDEFNGAISIDNYGGGQIAAGHLIEIGCKNIGHVCGPTSNFEACERKRGFFDRASDAGLEVPNIFEGDFSEESGYQAGIYFAKAKNRPDGIFVANDMMAVGCLMALADQGVNVPNDIAIIGFDDIPIARFTAPTLTTLNVGVYEIGTRSLDLLANGIENDDGTIGPGFKIEPELVARKSTAKGAN